MAITVKHKFVSAIPDAGDPTIVQPSNWNDTHDLVGTVPIANGGTNASTATGAINNLLPSQTGNSGKVLSTDGTNTSWTASGGSGTVTSVAATAGTGISVTGSPITTSGTLNITNTAPDQTVVLTAGTGISTSGTYPNFTITNTSPSLGGDVVGPASATDNAVARFDSTTGKLIQNSVVIVSDAGAVTGVTTLAASTSITTPIVQATNSGGLALKNSAGTTQISMGAGGGDNASINVSTNINGANAQIDISPTGTGHVHINPTGVNSIQVNPTYVGTMDNMTIGATTPKNGSFVDLSVTGTTSFDGSQGTAGQVLTSAGTGATPTWTTPTTGTVTSVTGTSPVVSSGGATPAISMPAATTSVNGYLTSTDWTTFNGKQALLVSGTNIKTINSNSILGSGDLAISASAAGSTTQVQYNNAGAFAGDADFTYNATANELKAGNINATNGLIVNADVVNTSYTIATGSNAFSVGPITTASGATVTVSSGQRWVVI
jgi:hypothetical protein